NAEFVLCAEHDPTFKKVLTEANLVLADGIGILWAAKYLGLKKCNLFTLLLSLMAIILRPAWIRTVLPEKVSGSDLFWPLLELCSKEKKKVFLLGAAPGVAEVVQQKALAKYPDLQVVGTFAGSPKESEENEIVTMINAAAADLLLVAYNFAAQEKWIQRNLQKFETVKLAIGIGGTFDFVAGTKAIGKTKAAKRAPLFLRKLGLESFWRLLTQPYRWRRVYNAVVRFPVLVYKNRG
ncbi:MAG: WecB/TagA/CpsF family glycosyltransferase, partial [Candidatus Gracilibacteria bacterium]|nr:WecB/TagA/CpsF family glycosyltransferase [Candidatus Gracilibacteria bacterium]